MPSILFLSLMNSDPWGGSEEQWFAFAQSLLQQGFRVAVVCHDWPGKKEKLQPLENEGATIYLLPGRNKTQNIFGKWKLKNQLHQIPFKDFDWVYVNQGGWKDIAHAPFSNFYKKLPRYMISYHNYDASAKLSLKKKKSMEAWVMHAAYNIADAKKVFEVFENIFYIKIPRQIVYHNPVSFVPPVSPPAFPPLENGNYLWCMLAALYKDRKAQDVLIETLSAQKWTSRNWILNLYGDGKDKEMLQELILKYGLEKKIFLKGHSKNVQEVLAHHHLVLQCTRIDAMPISISEAMAMARPCVVTNVGDMPLWVQNGINGFVCDFATVESIDEGLEKCWEKRNDWSEMGKASYAIFAQKYSIPYAGKFIELVNE